MIGDRHRRWLSGALGLVIAAAVVARAATLLAVDPWYDELYSLYAASGQPGDAWSAAVADRVHPPGFYLILWGWLQLVDPTPLGLRLLPFLGWLAMLGAFAWMGARLGLDRLRTQALVAFAAVNPVLFEFGAFVRGYSLLIAVVALALGAAATELRRQPHSPWQLPGLLVAATWLHYFSWPVVGAVALTFAWQRRWREALRCTAAPVVAFLPWIAAMAGSDATASAVGGSLAFIDTPGIWELLTVAGPLVAAMTGVFGLIVALIVGEAMVRWPERPTRGLLALATTLPIVTAFAATHLTPLGAWGLRYLAVAIPALLVALVGQTRAAPRVGSVYLGLMMVAAGTGILASPTPSTPWREVHATVSTNGVANAYANEGFVLLPLRYQALVQESSLRVHEVPGLPPPDAPPGWLVLRPALLPEGYEPTDALHTMDRTVTDSFAMGDGWLEVRGWKFR